jgi:hypothetical protein
MWVTNLNEGPGKDFFLLHQYLTLAPNLSASVMTNTSPHGNARVTVFLQWTSKAFTSRQDTQVDLLHQDASVHHPSSLSDLLGGSACMDVDVDIVETELNAYTTRSAAGAP